MPVLELIGQGNLPSRNKPEAAICCGIMKQTRPTFGPLIRLTIWFSSTWLGQRIYVRLVPPVDRYRMLWSKGMYSVSPHNDPNGVGGLALLTTLGARSGKIRHTPLGFARDKENLVILASNAARTRHPAWYWNIKKNPEVTVTIAGGGQGRYRADVVEPGPERDRLWSVLCTMIPGFEEYPARTGGRVMPVILCTPIEDVNDTPQCRGHDG